MRHWSYASALATGNPITLIPTWANPLAQFEDGDSLKLLWTDGDVQTITRPLANLSALHPDWLPLLVNLHVYEAGDAGDEAAARYDDAAHRADQRRMLTLDIERGELPEVPACVPAPALHGYATQQLQVDPAQSRFSPRPYLLVTHQERSCFFQSKAALPEQSWLDYILNYSVGQQLQTLFRRQA